MAAVSIQPIARWTTTASILLIVNKILGRNQIRVPSVEMPLLFARPRLIPIIVRKCWISLAIVAIGNVGIDAILLGVGNRGAAVIARIGRHFMHRTLIALRIHD